jgi:hypothetical protein
VYECVIRVSGVLAAGPEGVFALFAQVVLARSAAALNTLLFAVC